MPSLHVARTCLKYRNEKPAEPGTSLKIEKPEKPETNAKTIPLRTLNDVTLSAPLKSKLKNGQISLNGIETWAFGSRAIREIIGSPGPMEACLSIPGVVVGDHSSVYTRIGKYTYLPIWWRFFSPITLLQSPRIFAEKATDD